MKFLLSIILLTAFAITSFSQEDEKYICRTPDIEAQYYGGNDSIFSYIQNNLVYPEDALEENEEGSVSVEFVVEKNGTISSVKVVRAVYPSIDEEAIRLVQNMPTWKPAVFGEGTCRSVVRIGMDFNLDFEKARRKRARKARRRRRKF